MSTEYAHPDVLVTTEWVHDHQQDPQVRIIESDEDLLLYNQGHIPGAVKIDWHTDLQDSVVRDYLGKQRFEELTPFSSPVCKVSAFQILTST